MAQLKNRGHFVWFDFMTSNQESAIEFYSSLFGWTTQQWETGDEPYTMWVNDGKALGGLMSMPPDSEDEPPYWIAYVAVDDTDDTADMTIDLGGKVHCPPTDIPEIGRFAVIGDTQGAAIAVFTPSSAPEETGAPPAVGEVSWCELAAADQAGAFSFYSELFGWEHQEAMNMGDAGVYQIFGLGEGQFGGIFTKPEGMPDPPMWLYYIRVADLDASLRQVSALGGEVINGPIEVPGGDRVAQCLDPQGALFALHCTA